MSKNIEKQYLKLLKDILDNGVEKDTRNGKTLSVFGRQIRHDMSKGFPLLTTKKMYWKGIVTELLWFLRGDTNIKFLVDNDCHIWDGDAWANYKKNSHDEDDIWNKSTFINKIKTDDEFAKKWGGLGPVYGKQWRRWPVYPNEYGEYESNPIDQIQNLINDLKTNPDSRRLMVNSYNVGELDSMVLPPCHYGFQVYTRELSLEERVQYLFYKTDLSKLYLIQPTEEQLNKENIPTRAISLMYNARSQDVPLGTPFNIASYALLLEIIGRMVNMVPDELITNMGDCHIYLNQIDGIKEQLTREPFELPKLVISDDINFTGTIDEFLNSCSISDFKIQGYQSHPTIKIPLSN
jgi:thymidylate synthase